MAGTAYGFAAGLNGIPSLPAHFLGRAYTVSWSPSAVLTITAPAQTVTVTGLEVGDAVFVSPPSQTAGVLIGACYVSAADTLSVQFVNPTVGSVTPPSGTYTVIAFRSSN